MQKKWSWKWDRLQREILDTLPRYVERSGNIKVCCDACKECKKH